MPPEHIQKFKADFPEYRDIPDQELAQYLISRDPSSADLFGDVALGRLATAPQPRPTPEDILMQGITRSGFGTVPYDRYAPQRVDLATAGPTVIGGTVGSLALAPFGAVPRAVGGALGTVAGRALAPAVGGEPPSATELLATGGLALLGEYGMSRALGQPRFRMPGSALGARPRPDAARVLEAAEEEGVELKLSDVSSSRTPAALERAMQQTPLGGEIITSRAVGQQGQLIAARDRFLASVQGVPEAAPTEVGAVGRSVQGAVRQIIDRTKGTENWLFNRVRELSNDAAIDVGPLKTTLADIVEQQSLRPKALRNQQLIAIARDVFKAKDLVPFRMAREWQVAFGELIAERGAPLSNATNAAAQRLFKVTSAAMEAGVARSANPEAAQLFRTARDFAARRRALFIDRGIAEVLDMDPEKAARMMLGGGGETALRNARTAILGSPEFGMVAPTAEARETWNMFRAHVLEGVFGEARDRSAAGLWGEAISGPRLGKALGRYSEPALRELLPIPGERKALRNISILATAVRQAERVGAAAGTSTTPQGVAIQTLIQMVGAAGGAATGAIFGGGAGAATGAATGTLAAWFAPVLLARRLTNPAFAQYVASMEFELAVRTAARAGRLMPETIRAMTRATAIAVAESDADR